jgi:hypothetical protein
MSVVVIFFYDFFPHGSTLRAYQTVHKRTKANLIHINIGVWFMKNPCVYSLGLSVRRSTSRRQVE